MATRLSRAESHAQTRQALLESAYQRFARDGYNATSIDAIAADAGYTKGAFYANFPTKAAIFLEIFEKGGRMSVDGLVARVEAAQTRPELERILIDWADERPSTGSWPLTILEFSRGSAEGSEQLDILRDVLRRHWALLGEAFLKKVPVDTDATTMGGLLFEIAYAPAMTFLGKPSAGDLMALYLAALRDQ